MRLKFAASLLALAGLALGVAIQAQPTAAPAQAPKSQSPAAAARPGTVAWGSLSAEQRTALKPLAAQWPQLHPDQQRKWIALSRNFNKMAPAEQATLQTRMTEWASLTPAQRTQARLSYGEVRRLPAEERKAKWEAYQSLSPEQRKQLADRQPKPPRSTAPALRPEAPDRILRNPVGLKARPGEGLAGPIDRSTLLPRTPQAAQ